MAKIAGANKPTTSILVFKREVAAVEEFAFDVGATRERVYHLYNDGRIISIERFTASDGFVRVAAIELEAHGGNTVVRHLFTSEGVK